MLVLSKLLEQMSGCGADMQPFGLLELGSDQILLQRTTRVIILYFSLEKVYLFKEERGLLRHYSKWMEHKTQE